MKIHPLITTTEALTELCERLSKADFITVDAGTERLGKGVLTLADGRRLAFEGEPPGEGAGVDDLFGDMQDFEFTVVNFGDSTLTGVLALQLDVHSNVGVSAEHFSTIPTIPEPSTYALMGLGLVGIGFAARRRRAA